MRQYLADAYDSGILTLSHRGKEFKAIYQQAVEGLQAKLGIPQDYAIYFLSSATECWSVLAEGAIRAKSLHVYSGNFGERWFEYTQALRPQAVGIRFGVEDNALNVLPAASNDIELVALTHNETSNGTRLVDGTLATVRSRYPQALLAVDVTSSLGGVSLPYPQADIWFGSVQKCLGLPAGLAVMAMNPRAVARVQDIGFKVQYNNLAAIHQQAVGYQTTHTPNVLGIYLLSRLVQDLPPIAVIEKQTLARAEHYYRFLENRDPFTPLVRNGAYRSQTVVAVNCPENRLEGIKEGARVAGMVLGSGYGVWKNNTFRIANFPALQDEQVSGLLQYLEKALA
jgi:phosphoserine aminotransferase